MIAGNRFIRNIVLILGIYLLVANVILWANSPSVNLALLRENWTIADLGKFGDFKIFHQYSFTNYRGFRWFFARISTFPGPAFTHSMLMTYANIVSGFTVTSNPGLDFLVAIFRVLSTPILLSITIVIDIINNAIWFFSFVWN